MGKRGSTLRQIAAEAGVSIATVSRVASGTGQVAPATRQKVQDAIDRQQFRPSRLGRALVDRRHAALGLVFPGLSGPYYSEVINGFEDVAVEANMGVVILGTHLLSGSVDLVLDMADRVDGVALRGGVLTEDQIRRIEDHGTPVLLLGGRPSPGLSNVRTENLSAMARLVTHLLIDHGYRDIIFIGDPDASPDVACRWEGFVQAHRNAQITPVAEPICVGFTQPQGFIAASRLISKPDHPRVLVCANDETALGAVVALMDRGYRVPQDVVVTGFDDIPMAGLFASGLTTVHQPMRELGRETARLLLENIDGRSEPVVDRVLETNLVIRRSCGCGDVGTVAHERVKELH